MCFIWNHFCTQFTHLDFSAYFRFIRCMFGHLLEMVKVKNEVNLLLHIESYNFFDLTRIYNKSRIFYELISTHEGFFSVKCSFWFWLCFTVIKLINQNIKLFQNDDIHQLNISGPFIVHINPFKVHKPASDNNTNVMKSLLIQV